MIADLMAEYGGRLLIAIAGVGLGLIGLVAVLKFLHQRNGPSPFVRGGKARTPRLQVVDAAAVDTRRRLVLVRRDDVEHLIMIGGPTDIVIEGNIAQRPTPETSASPPPAEERLARPETAVARPQRPAEPPASRPAPARPASSGPARAEPTPAPLDRPMPVTPQAAYLEASEPAASTPAPQPADPQAVRQAEAHLEAIKRKMQPTEAPTRQSAEPAKPSAFGQVLENEMKAPLRETPRRVPPAIQQLSPREPQAAPSKPDGAPEANLQNEIARIFGEKN